MRAIDSTVLWHIVRCVMLPHELHVQHYDKHLHRAGSDLQWHIVRCVMLRIERRELHRFVERDLLGLQPEQLLQHDLLPDRNDMHEQRHQHVQRPDCNM